MSSDGSDDHVRGAIRAATPADLDRLTELARAFYDEDGFTTPDGELRANFQVLLAADNAHVAVVDDSSIATAFALTTTSFILESGLVAELQDLYVEPRNRRRGIATALIEESAQWASSVGATALELVIAPNGQDVTHLFDYYAGRGFRDEGRTILIRSL